MHNEKNVQKVLRFFRERLRHTKGKYAGQPFDPDPWEEQVLRDLFGTVKPDGETRQYETAYIEIGKKNGKSELGAGIALYCFFMDDEPGVEVYSAAFTRKQASIVFGVAATMIRMEPKLLAECKILESTKTIYMKGEPQSFYQALSADADIQDGVNPHCVVFDELHRQKNRDLWDVFDFGTSARSQPILLALTTAGVVGESPICEEQHDRAKRVLDGVTTDPSFYPVIYGLGEKEDWTEEGHPAKYEERIIKDSSDRRRNIKKLIMISPATGWYKANPALGSYLSVERLRRECKRALETPALQNSFRRFRCCQWPQQESRAIDAKKWAACGHGIRLSALIGRECYGGLDLSSTKDLTALILIFPMGKKYIWLPFIFVPEEGLNERVRKDNVRYDIWAKQDMIFLTPGNEVDYGFVRKKILDCAEIYNIREIGYDRWNAVQMVQTLRNEDGLTMEPIGQGFASMNAPTSEFLSWINTKTLIHNNNDCLTWMADCLSTLQDAAGNIKPSKPDRKKTGKRVDGMVAGINAIARIITTEEYKKKSVYEERGIISIDY